MQAPSVRSLPCSGFSDRPGSGRSRDGASCGRCLAWNLAAPARGPDMVDTPPLRLLAGWSRYPDMRDEPETMLALDAEGREVGIVKPGTAGWDWQLADGDSRG